MEEITKDILDSLSPEELLKLEELFDPVSWCENNLSNPETPYIKFSLHTPGDERPYQADILKFQIDGELYNKETVSFILNKNISLFF